MRAPDAARGRSPPTSPMRKTPSRSPPPSSPRRVAHFADHCATCHGNDGKGQTAIGQKLYPRAPDMTLPDTQELSDGALFAIIENGIRLTGMPGWGSRDRGVGLRLWTLVHFIRHLPELTPDELDAMETLNPKSPEEWKQIEAEEAFLTEESDAPAPAPADAHDAASHPH